MNEYSYDDDDNMDDLRAESSRQRRMDRQRHADSMYELSETGFDLDDEYDEEEEEEEGGDA